MSGFKFQDRFTQVTIEDNIFTVNASKLYPVLEAWQRRANELIEKVKRGNEDETETIKDLCYGAFSDILGDEDAGDKIWATRSFDWRDAIDLLYWIKDEVSKFNTKEALSLRKKHTPQLNRAQRRAKAK